MDHNAQLGLYPLTLLVRLVVAICACLSLFGAERESYSRILAAVVWSFSVNAKPGLTGTACEGMEHYREFRAMPGGVLVFNHPTFLDPMILCKELKCPLKFLYKEAIAKVSFIRVCAEKAGAIPVCEGRGGATEALGQAIRERAAFDNVIAVAPSGAGSLPEQHMLPAFKTGAFVHGTHILPVVIKYDPYPCIRWPKSDTMAKAFKDRLIGPPVEYVLKILPIMYPAAGEDVNVFKERVKAAMEAALTTDDTATIASTAASGKTVKPYPGSRLLLLTSIMFGLIGVCAITNGKIVFGIGMLITSLTSMAYHWSGNQTARKIDMYTNIAMAIVCVLLCLIERRYVPIACILFVAYQYWYMMQRGHKSPFDHCMLVHLPMVFGLLSIATT